MDAALKTVTVVTALLLAWEPCISRASTVCTWAPSSLNCRVQKLENSLGSLKATVARQDALIRGLILSQQHAQQLKQPSAPTTQKSVIAERARAIMSPGVVEANAAGPAPERSQHQPGVVPPAVAAPQPPQQSRVGEGDFPRDCAEAYARGHVAPGVQSLRVLSALGSAIDYEAYCDGGWTVLMRNGWQWREQKTPEGQTMFDRSWEEFRKGFGRQEGAHWLGNEIIRALTNSKTQKLRVEVKHSPDLWCEPEHSAVKHAEYAWVRVGSEQSSYRLQLGEYSGTMGNVLDCRSNRGLAHKGMQFSTRGPGRDHDYWFANCAEAMGGGFWHNDCGAAKFTERLADYLNCDTNHWHYEMQWVVMKIRPA